MGRNFIVWLKVLVSAKCRLIQVHVYLGKYLLQYSALFNCLTFRSKILCAVGEFGQNLGHINGRKGLFLPTFSIIAFPRKEPTFLISAQIFPSKLLEPAEQSMVSPSSSEEKMLSQVLFRRTIHVAEVPNSCKILLYWLLRSKIWYFRVIWLFIAKFFYKNGIFLCFLEGRGKKSKQNDTAGFLLSWILFNRMRQCVSYRYFYRII